MKSKFKWEGPKVERAVFNKIRRNGRAAGRHVRDVMRKEAPRRSGFLRKNIKHAVSARQSRKNVVIKVGAVFRAFYAKFFQFGTVKMDARPFANTRAVMRAADKARRILIGKN